MRDWWEIFQETEMTKRISTTYFIPTNKDANTYK
jgi:hypothetical protein